MSPPPAVARVLAIAGSDSGGGAGIQADIKTIAALGGYAMTAITALTAQNTQGVFGVHPVPPAFIRQQLQLVLEDIGADALKTGMLHSAEVIAAVAETIAELAPSCPLVVDPVMVAKGGHCLLREDAVEALRAQLLPRAAVVTPNLPEAEALAGLAIGSPEEMEEAGRRICALGAQAVLMKGGHLEGEEVIDILIIPGHARRFVHPRIHTRSTHGTGCTLASAIATGLAQGLSVEPAVARAILFVEAALRRAPGLGQGHGPLAHQVTTRPFP